MRPVVRTAGLKCIFSLNMGDAHRGKLTHDFVILSRRHHHMLFVILFIFLLCFNLSSAKLHIFFQYANFFAIIFSFSSSLHAFTLLYSTALVWARSLLIPRAPMYYD